MEAGESLTRRSVRKIVVESPMPSGTMFWYRVLKQSLVNLSNE